MFLIPKCRSVNKMQTAFCSYQKRTKESGSSFTEHPNASASAFLSVLSRSFCAYTEQLSRKTGKLPRSLLTDVAVYHGMQHRQPRSVTTVGIGSQLMLYHMILKIRALLPLPSAPQAEASFGSEHSHSS